MKVQDIMIKNVSSCTPSSDLESVAMKMWNEDCGSVPVIDEQGRPIAMITDRDICIATAMQHRAPGQIKVSDVIGNRASAVTCRPDQDVSEALRSMQEGKVRRLPVVDEQGRLCGIISISDIVSLAPGSGRADGEDLAYPRVMSTLKSVTGHHRQQSQ